MPGRIEDYGLIGDCTTAALVSRDGSIDWLCWPYFDSDACFAALLGDDRNGRWRIAPEGEALASGRCYRDGTLILETAFETADGAVTIIDFMPGSELCGDLVRLVRGDRRTVRMHMELVIRFGSGANVPWVKRTDDGALLAIGGPDMAILRTPVETRGEDLTTVADFEVREGETVPFVLSYTASHRPVPEPIDAEDALVKTESFWREWSGRCSYDGKHERLIKRSLMTLKALTFAPTGGIVAAPTASLPERPKSTANWDYRFCWLRDATFTLLALINSGYFEEALAWHNWLLRSVAGAPSEMQIMYGIDGSRRLLEWEAEWLSGYEGARPVRFGNAAHAQLQLDVYGELMDVFHQARMAKLKLDSQAWDLECALLDHLEDIWHEPDCGMWEKRGAPRHYVSSKIMAWVAFDRGIKSAREFGFEAPVERWCEIRETIHREICAKGFDSELNAFIESYGSEFLDASVLLVSAVGFLPPDDRRVMGTLAAAERYLLRDGLIMRHDPRQIDRQGRPDEGAFLACTLWLADAYILAGNVDRATELFETVCGYANDLGLLAEEYDVGAKRLCGNFPQALTHIALINTAHNLHRAAKPVVQRAA